MTVAPELPDKLYFKIGEVAKIVGVKPYVLRYWESEFSVVRPAKARSQHRVYRRRDVETLLGIKDLLYNQRYTIEGAKRRLRELQRAGAPVVPPAPRADHLMLGGPEARYRVVLDEVKKELLAIYATLEDDPCAEGERGRRPRSAVPPSGSPVPTK
jgi:DNA-binding transcriptional MerR regulator